MHQAIGMAIVLLTLTAGLARAGDDAPRALADRAHPCTFYRGQAHRMGVAHFATEMLWACEAIAARRAAGMALSDRLLATEFALSAYRQAVAADREDGERRSYLSMSEVRKREIAEQTGVLAALQAISEGF